MFEALEVNTTLSTLNVASVHQQQDNTKQDTTSTEMTKTGNDFGVEGAQALSEALKINTSLTTLDLRCVQQSNGKQEHGQLQQKRADNKIRDEGASVLSEALKVNTTLTALKLECVQQQQDEAKQECNADSNEPSRHWDLRRSGNTRQSIASQHITDFADRVTVHKEQNTLCTPSRLCGYYALPNSGVECDPGSPSGSATAHLQKQGKKSDNPTFWKLQMCEKFGEIANFFLSTQQD